MTHTISFDGETRLISVDSTETETIINVAEIYSEWKRWVATDEGSIWEPAFSNAFGGDQVSPTRSLARYYIVNNFAGWRIRPPDLDGALFIEGNVYPVDPEQETFAPVPGRSMVTGFDRAAAAQDVAITDIQLGQFAQRVWDATTADHVVPGSFGDLVQRTRRTLNAVLGIIFTRRGQ